MNTNEQTKRELEQKYGSRRLKPLPKEDLATEDFAKLEEQAHRDLGKKR